MMHPFSSISLLEFLIPPSFLGRSPPPRWASQNSKQLARPYEMSTFLASSPPESIRSLVFLFRILAINIFFKRIANLTKSFFPPALFKEWSSRVFVFFKKASLFPLKYRRHTGLCIITKFPPTPPPHPVLFPPPPRPMPPFFQVFDGKGPPPLVNPLVASLGEAFDLWHFFI